MKSYTIILAFILLSVKRVYSRNKADLTVSMTMLFIIINIFGVVHSMDVFPCFHGTR